MKKRVDKVIILWTANTEMYMLPEIEDISAMKAKVERNSSMPASVIFCIAAIEE
jgi:myo-inositol-1-phosphate synthase